MATNTFEKEFKRHGSVVLSRKSAFAGSDVQYVNMFASRLMLDLNITANSGTVTLQVENSIDPDRDFRTILQQDYSGVQHVSIPLADLHQFLIITVSVAGGSASYTLGGTALEASGVPGSAGMLPLEYDKLEITSINGNGDPLVVEYSLGSDLVATLTLTYDLNGNVESVIRS